MPAEPPITTEGKVLEALDGHTYVVELPNGKVIHAHLPRRKQPITFEPGDLLALEMNPYDFSRARIRPPDSPSNQEPKS